MRRRAVLLPLIGAVAVLVGSCSSSSAPAETGELTVFAASSLKDSFTAIGAQFEAAHPGVKVTFNFAGSGDLATQIGQGAPVDVFASADESTMAKAVGSSGATAKRFASNQLAIIVAANNPKKITGLADLARSDVTLVIGAPEVPIGKYSAQVLDKAGVKVSPKSLEQNVKAIVAKVTLGEADAGIVYVTDVQAAGAKAAGVPIPADVNVVAHYPIVELAKAPHAALAAKFVAFVMSADAQQVLAKAGFGAA